MNQNNNYNHHQKYSTIPAYQLRQALADMVVGSVQGGLPLNTQKTNIQLPTQRQHHTEHDPCLQLFTSEDFHDLLEHYGFTIKPKNYIQEYIYNRNEHNPPRNTQPHFAPILQKHTNTKQNYPPRRVNRGQFNPNFYFNNNRFNNRNQPPPPFAQHKIQPTKNFNRQQQQYFNQIQRSNANKISTFNRFFAFSDPKFIHNKFTTHNKSLKFNPNTRNVPKKTSKFHTFHKNHQLNNNNILNNKTSNINNPNVLNLNKTNNINTVIKSIPSLNSKGRYWSFCIGEPLKRINNPIKNLLPFYFSDIVFEHFTTEVFNSYIRPYKTLWTELIHTCLNRERLVNNSIISIFTTRANSRHFSISEEQNHQHKKLLISDIENKIQETANNLFLETDCPPKNNDILRLAGLKLSIATYFNYNYKLKLWNYEGPLREIVVTAFKKAGFTEKDKILFNTTAAADTAAADTDKNSNNSTSNSDIINLYKDISEPHTPLITISPVENDSPKPQINSPKKLNFKIAKKDRIKNNMPANHFSPTGSIKSDLQNFKCPIAFTDSKSFIEPPSSNLTFDLDTNNFNHQIATKNNRNIFDPYHTPIHTIEQLHSDDINQSTLMQSKIQLPKPIKKQQKLKTPKNLAEKNIDSKSELNKTNSIPRKNITSQLPLIQCCICNKQFHKGPGLSIHIGNCMKDNNHLSIFKCHICQTDLLNQRQIYDHLVAHSLKEDFQDGPRNI